ncbi:MAG TPA: efflux RND transporter periplasmic adaptor subunit [Xanthobacteraceae bacterium]|jgi:HlyD family secretion protein|nr:efflux RND transporter periplasmic adaptor subunit [Xanthobacteraceae bacterium]
MAIAVGFAAGAGLLVGTASFGAEPPASNRVGAAVSVMKAKRECFKDYVDVTGVLVPKEEVLVRPDREGLQIAKVFVEAGDTVKSGQVLARLAPPEGQPGSGVDVQSQVAGLVIRRSAIVGAMASARAEPLFQIVPQGELEIAAEIPAKRFSSVSIGQPATIRIVGMPELTGRIRFASPAIDPTTQLGQIRVSLGDRSQLRAGTFARAIIDVAQRCGVGIPFSAVLYGSEGAVVQLVRDGRVETHRVALGLQSEDTVEVREGVNDGDMVVARAGSFVREGDRVRPIMADEGARPK